MGELETHYDCLTIIIYLGQLLLERIGFGLFGIYYPRVSSRHMIQEPAARIRGWLNSFMPANDVRVILG